MRTPNLALKLAPTRWAFDIFDDQFPSGRRFCILNSVGDVARVRLAAIQTPRFGVSVRFAS